MLAMIVMVIKLLIGGTISYVLPSFAIKDIKEKDHLKITSIGIFSTALFSISYQLDSTSNGLSYAVEKFKSHDIAGHMTLVRGERSKVATLAAKIL